MENVKLTSNRNNNFVETKNCENFDICYFSSFVSQRIWNLIFELIRFMIIVYWSHNTFELKNRTIAQVIIGSVLNLIKLVAYGMKLKEFIGILIDGFFFTERRHFRNCSMLKIVMYLLVEFESRRRVVRFCSC